MAAFDYQDFLSQGSMREICQELNEFLGRTVTRYQGRTDEGYRRESATLSLVVDFIRDPGKLVSSSLDTEIATVQKWKQDLIESKRDLGQILVAEEETVEGRKQP